MEIHQLEQFRAIVEYGTMSEAAEKLYVSQPALSQNIKKLEAELGCQLFTRSKNRLQVTQYGEALLDKAHRILFDLKEIQDEIDAIKLKESQTLKIGSFYSVLSAFFMPQIANLLPEYNFHGYVAPSEQLKDDLFHGDADIAFLLDKDVKKGLFACRIFQEALLLSVKPDSPYADRSSYQINELPEAEYIIPQGFSGLSDWYQEALMMSGIPQEQVKMVPDKDYLLQMDDMRGVHFSTTLMSAFTGSANARLNIPIEGNNASRSIMAVWRNLHDGRIDAVVSLMESDSRRLAGGHAFLASLIVDDRGSNLTLDLEKEWRS